MTNHIDKFNGAADELSAALRDKIATLGPVKCAKRAGMKYNDISLWYNGHRKWSLEKISRVFSAL